MGAAVMDGWEIKYREYLNLRDTIGTEGSRLNRHLKSVSAKWPETFGNEYELEPPSDESADDYFPRREAYLAVKKLEVNYSFLKQLNSCLASVLSWPVTTETDRAKRNEAFLDITDIISQLEIQVKQIQQLLSQLRDFGYPAALFGAPE